MDSLFDLLWGLSPLPRKGLTVDVFVSTGQAGVSSIASLGLSLQACTSIYATAILSVAFMGIVLVLSLAVHRTNHLRPGKMAQWLTPYTNLAEDLSSIPSTCCVARSYL